MPAARPVPVAWSNLTHDRVRFALFVLGIAFAVVLMGVQMGIRNALIDSNCRIIDRVAADLVLVHPHRASLFYREGVARRRLVQAGAVEGVASVHPLYIDYSFSLLSDCSPPGRRNPTRTIRVVGLDPDAGLLDFPELAPGSWTAEALRTPGAALFDRRAKADRSRPGQTVYGPYPVGDPGRWDVRTELNGRDLTVVGGFDLGTDFAADGTLLVGEKTFLDWVRGPMTFGDPAAAADLGLVRVVGGEDPGAVRDRVRAALAAGPENRDRDVEVLTKAQCREREVLFWLTMTPIGFAFNAGIILGFVVGFVICYQILAGDVADHTAEYATLRAIGYRNSYLSLVVLEESVLLAAAGFVPGVVVTAGIYALLAAATGLPVSLTPGRAGWVLLATVAMCVGSGLLALRKAQTVDPANVF